MDTETDSTSSGSDAHARMAAAITSGELALAGQIFDEHIGSASGDSKLRLLIDRAWMLSQMEERAQARACLGDALPLAAGTRRPWILLRLAHQLMRHGEVAAAKEALRQCDGPSMRQRREILERRLDFGRRVDEDLADNKIVVPLGNNCIPDMLVMRCGLDSRLFRSPFRSGIFMGDGVVNALDESLRAFHDRSAYSLTETQSGKPLARIKQYKSVFVHDTGPFWLGDDLERLVAKYSAAATAFLDVCREHAPLFVVSQWFPQADMRSQFLGALDRLFPNASFRLLFLDLIGVDALDHPHPDERVRVIRAPILGREHELHLAQNFNTQDSLEFDRPLIEAVVHELEALS